MAHPRPVNRYADWGHNIFFSTIKSTPLYIIVAYSQKFKKSSTETEMLKNSLKCLTISIKNAQWNVSIHFYGPAVKTVSSH